MSPKINISDKFSAEAFRSAATAFFASRIVCALFVYLGHFYRQSPNPVPGVWGGIENPWLNPWTTFDSVYYLAIANTGYQPLTAPFFPLYPSLLNLGGNSQTGMAVAGILISNLAFAAALYFLHRLTEMDYGHEAATAAVWLLAFFPTTAFFSALYTESTFLLLILLCFYSARKQQWMLAGLAGGLAGLCRNPGVLLFIALGLEYLQEKEYALNRLELPHLFFVSLPAISFLGVQGYLWKVLGTPLASVSAQQQFYRAPTWPWESIWRDMTGFFTYLDFDLITFMNLTSIFLAFALAIRFRMKMRPAYSLILFGLIFMNLVYAQKYPPHTTSTLRYLSTTFPFLQLLGFYSVQPRSLPSKLRLACSGLYFYIFLLFSFLFGLKSFTG